MTKEGEFFPLNKQSLDLIDHVYTIAQRMNRILMIKNNKYRYPKTVREVIEGKRHYNIDDKENYHR